MKNSLFISICCFIALGCAIGCGSKNPLGVVKVTGKVTLDGQPISGATVSFVPKSEADGQLASATTDAEGGYSLTTAGAGDIAGAVPGTYSVILRKFEQEDVLGTGEEATSQGPSYAAPKVTRILPAKYENATTSGLSATVEKRGQNVFDFDLKKE